MTKEGFSKFPSDELVYNYSWKYITPPASKEEEKELSDRLMEDIADEVYLEDFLPRYINQAIQFTGEDMGGDRAMMLILLLSSALCVPPAIQRWNWSGITWSCRS